MIRATLLIFLCFSPILACLDSCKFTLCTPSAISLTSPSDVALTSPICRKGKPVGIVNTGEALVASSSAPYVPISEIRPKGLKQNFSPSFFKTYPIVNSSSSGVGHEVPQQNQDKFLGVTCVALPIREYQRINRKGVVKRNIKFRGRPLVNCVSFMTDRRVPPKKK